MNDSEVSWPARIEDLRLFSGSANRPLAEAVARQLGIELSALTVTHLADTDVAPDVGRARLAGKYAEQLEMPLVIMHKRRLGFSETRTATVVGDIQGKTAILIDDLVAGGSVLDQAPALIEAGAEPPVYLSITHPVLLPSALERLNREEIAELVTTDTILLPPHKRHPKLRIQSIAPLLAEVIKRIHCGETISPLLRLQ